MEVDNQSGDSAQSAKAQLTAVRRNSRTRRWAAGLILVLAAVTVASALSTPLADRLGLLLEIMPFPILHTAAATTVFAGFGLAMTARGLWQGHRIAWAGAIGLLGISAALNLVKGLDIEEGVLSTLLACWLIFRMRAFTVSPTRGQVRRALIVAGVGFLFAVTTAMVLVLTLGHRHHPHVGETFRAAAERLGGVNRLPLLGMGPAATPLLAAAGISIILSVLWLVMSPRWSPAENARQRMTNREQARAIVAQFGGGTLDYFALRDDKQWFFTGSSVVAYAVVGGTCLVSPDPIGPWSDRYQTWADFITFSTGHGWSVAVVAAASRWQPVYEISKMHSVNLGSEAIVEVTGFTLKGGAVKGLRQAVNRVERAGITAKFIDPTTASDQLRDGVMAICDKSRRGETERGFSMTLSRLFNPADTGLLMVIATDSTARVLGFIQWVPAFDLPGWSLDVMRRDTAKDVPNGLTDFLIVKTIEHIFAQGARGLGLNFAVMRDAMATPPQGFAGQVKRRVLDVVAKHSQLDSLGTFNEKYDPVWVPRYVILGSGDGFVTQGLAVAQAEGLIDSPSLRRTR